MVEEENENEESKAFMGLTTGQSLTSIFTTVDGNELAHQRTIRMSMESAQTRTPLQIGGSTTAAKRTA